MQLSMNATAFISITDSRIILNGGGPDWTRTSDPRLIKAVL